MDPTEESMHTLMDAAVSSKTQEMSVWQTIATALGGLDKLAQIRVLKSVITLLELDLSDSGSRLSPARPSRPSEPDGATDPSYSASEERNLSPKEFLHQKRPATDVDKIVCLAYYLTHFRNTPHFKTFDLSQLNTEAAQIKFSNAAYTVDHAAKAGLLVPAGKGQKQISAAGEVYVRELPDKSAARAAIEGYRRRRAKKSGTKQPKGNGEE